MIKRIHSIIDRTKLRAQLVEKQRLFAQMQKDDITGHVKDQLSREIGDINMKLHTDVKQ